MNFIVLAAIVGLFAAFGLFTGICAILAFILVRRAMRRRAARLPPPVSSNLPPPPPIPPGVKTVQVRPGLGRRPTLTPTPDAEEAHTEVFDRLRHQFADEDEEGTEDDDQ